MHPLEATHLLGEVGTAMNLSLDRPIAFIDLETTGLNPSFDRIVELSVLKVHPDGSEEVRSAG